MKSGKLELNLEDKGTAEGNKIEAEKYQNRKPQ
jgi:hypothetical protein